MLNRHDRTLFVSNPFNRPVEKIAMGHFGNFGDGIGNVVVMILRRNLDNTRHDIFDRMVSAVMAELQLVGIVPVSDGEKLMAKTDPEHRHFRLDQFSDFGLLLFKDKRVSWTIGEENAVDIAAFIACDQFICIDRIGYHFDRHTGLRKLVEDIPLDPEIERDDFAFGSGASL